ncbi:group I truncated hemoglobin [Cyclobacterium jeungdonense]|uniref:Group 1 truncated hemoglobin n=1 Tax=Cyclobacterium jeungdonense TaxID=708087 RepID=A0ABT8C6I5_9BACT|nr:group 1 truncated hemoglobin [Cyclobacterium jeungdonense]MDN3688115.1 group 1 truncated hemoglobin [Cyclobacterium jeungdonense]
MSTSLFERLGAEKGIIKIVDDVVEAHMNNPVISARFTPYLEQPENLAKVKSHTVNFFITGSGGPQVYAGRTMETTHRGMNISAEEYMETMDDIFLVLDKHGKDAQTKKDVLEILWSLKGMIIGK